MKTLHRVLLAGTFLFMIAGFRSASAQIVWGSLPSITGDSDISLDGSFTDAAGGFMTGDPTTTVTINPSTSVTFNNVSDSNGTYSDGKDISFSNIVGIGGDGVGGPSDPGQSLPFDYRDALTGVAYVGHGSTPLIGTVTLSNLTAGDEYQVEVWQGMPNGEDGDTDTTYASVGTTSSATTAGYDYVIGTFEAPSGGSQSFTFTSASTGEINAIELRDLGAVPEPGVTALLMAGLGAVALLAVRRRYVSV